MLTYRKRGTWSESAQRVLAERYLWKDEKGQLKEDADGMCWRVAEAIAQAEKVFQSSIDEARFQQIAESFYDIMIEGKFMPNSPTLMNAGKGNDLQFSACFVLPVPDSIDGIFDSIKHAAIIHKSGGGTGFAFSRLRPEGATVQTTTGVASGPVSFMKIFDAATEQIKQGGTRRGANMGILRVDHPDILQFINCKLDGGITNFNISVAATDRYMDALDKGESYDLIDPKSGDVVGSLDAGEVFRQIVEAAWRTGDPGLVFIDRINRSSANPVPSLETIEATNPCGEQPLAPYDACNLGSINLAEFVKPSGIWHYTNGSNPAARIDWTDLERVTRTAVRFLDDVIEVNPYPLEQITIEVKANRRIGLGVMGWADMLYKLGIPYDSEEALMLAGQVMGFLKDKGHDESANLANERGPFQNWSQSIYKDGPPLRNGTVTTIAPTGTISIISGCSSGVEPIFALAFSHIVGNRHLTFVNPHFENVAKELGFYTPQLMDEVAHKGTVEDIAGVPDDVGKVFVTAHDIAPEWHVRMQAAFQKYTDNGVSKTVNMPNSATAEDIADTYLLAYKERCLGITVFRNGSKDTQVLHVGTGSAKGHEEEERREASPSTFADRPYDKIKPRPKTVHGATHRAETPLGTAFITVNRNGNDEPFEVFMNVGKAGSDIAALAEAMGRLISLNLRLPSSMSPTERMKQMMDQLWGIGGGRSLGFGKDRVRSLPDAVARVLAEELGVATEETSDAGIEGHAPSKIADICPECGLAALVYEEGCQKCYSCGFSEC